MEEYGQFAEWEFMDLTALRRAQGRPDPLTIEVFVESPMRGPLSEIGIRLWHREGETESFDLEEPADAEGTFGPSFELLVTDSMGESRSSRVKSEHKPMDRIGAWYVIHFVPGYVWGKGAVPRVRGALFPPAPRLVEPHLVSPFPLRGYEWDPPLKPGSYTLIVRLREGSLRDEVTLDSEPVEIVILPRARRLAHSKTTRR